MRADLHVHTTASDGCWSPERVVAEARARGIELLAIADHDTVASVPTAEDASREAGLAFLRGVEISTRLDGRLFHILAYGFELGESSLLKLLRDNQASIDRHDEKVVRDFIAAGYPIDLEAYETYEYDPGRGGWKMLNFLIDQGLCTGARDFFDNLAADLSELVPPYPHPGKAIAAIRQAGGVPILAHPGISLRPVEITEETLRPFLDFGIAGLECYSHYHDEATTHQCLDWCRRHDRLVTGGSDCHGGFVGRELGIPVVDTADLRLGELEGRIRR